MRRQSQEVERCCASAVIGVAATGHSDRTPHIGGLRCWQQLQAQDLPKLARPYAVCRSAHVTTATAGANISRTVGATGPWSSSVDGRRQTRLQARRHSCIEQHVEGAGGGVAAVAPEARLESHLQPGAALPAAHTETDFKRTDLLQPLRQNRV